jgi:hypothetical protein
MFIEYTISSYRYIPANYEQQVSIDRFCRQAARQQKNYFILFMTPSKPATLINRSFIKIYLIYDHNCFAGTMY